MTIKSSSPMKTLARALGFTYGTSPFAPARIEVKVRPGSGHMAMADVLEKRIKELIVEAKGPNGTGRDLSVKAIRPEGVSAHLWELAVQETFQRFLDQRYRGVRNFVGTMSLRF
jgi:hypothetical protein